MAITKGRPSDFKDWINDITYIKQEDKEGLIALVGEWKRDMIIDALNFEEAEELIAHEIYSLENIIIDQVYGSDNTTLNRTMEHLDNFANKLKALARYSESYIQLITTYKESPGPWIKVALKANQLIHKISPFLKSANTPKLLSEIITDLLLNEEHGEKVQKYLMNKDQIDKGRFLHIIGEIDFYLDIFTPRMKEKCAKTLGGDRKLYKRLFDEDIKNLINSIHNKYNH